MLKTLWPGEIKNKIITKMTNHNTPHFLRKRKKQIKYTKISTMNSILMMSSSMALRIRMKKITNFRNYLKTIKKMLMKE